MKMSPEALILANDSIVKCLLGFLVDSGSLSEQQVRELLEAAANSQLGPGASRDNKAAADHIRQMLAAL